MIKRVILLVVDGFGVGEVARGVGLICGAAGWQQAVQQVLQWRSIVHGTLAVD